MTRLRKICRFLHRELGFLAVGLTLAYAISGVAVNHTEDWNPSYEQVTTDWTIAAPGDGPTEEVAPVVLERLALTDPILNVWRATQNQLRVIVPSGTVDVDLRTGEVHSVVLEPRPLLRDVNYLHLNQGKGLWTWVADGYAVVLAILALTGILLVKGRRGLSGRGGVLMAAGFVIPVVFVLLGKYV